MRQPTRKYTEEFKKQAVDLAKELDSISRAATQLGISTVNIYDWRKKLDQVTPSSIELTNLAEREELGRLRKEVSELKKINHILKSAAAFFSQDHLK